MHKELLEVVDKIRSSIQYLMFLSKMRELIEIRKSWYLVIFDFHLNDKILIRVLFGLYLKIVR